MTMLFTEPMDPGLASLLRFRKSIPPDIAKAAPYSLETGAQQLAQELGCKPCGLVRAALRRIGTIFASPHLPLSHPWRLK